MPSGATCYDFPLLKDEVSAIVQDAVLSTLEGHAYDHAKVNDWINVMTSSCIEDLKKLCAHFKYIVTCFVRQRKGAPIEIASTCYWDEKSDSACTVSWENTSISVVIVVYGVAI